MKLVVMWCGVFRYHRVAGRDVFFLTGTDEHGQKIAESAEKAVSGYAAVLALYIERNEDIQILTK